MILTVTEIVNRQQDKERTRYPVPKLSTGMKMDHNFNCQKPNRIRMMKHSLKLNMKRDNARTLMLKMDARLTFAGRERNAIFKQETERELKHIEATMQLTNADLNRARMDMQRRFDFYQELKEQNRERRSNREIAWCLEEESDWEQEARAARRRRTLPKIEVRKNHEAEAIGSIRRDQKKELANKLTHEKRINRSLNALNRSYVKHKALAEQNKAVLERMGADANCDETKTNIGESEDDLLPLKDKTKGPPEISKANLRLRRLPTRKTCLPELKTGKMSVNGPENKSLSGTVVLNHLIPHKVKHEFPTTVAPSSKSTTHSFPVHASINNVKNSSDPTPDQFTESSTSSRTQHAHLTQSVHTTDLHDGAFGRARYGQIPRPNHSPKPPKRKISLPIPPQQSVPIRFYETEENPFMKDGALPSIVSRSSDLANADKADEIFEWLGFESKQEFENLRAAGLATEYDGVDGVNVEPDARSAAPTQKDTDKQM